ncbi:MAG: alpha/beta hydrolase [Comamonadaceae bacterium]|nr:alpha/beta hydrolase [Comamonadaceae bacterium]
MAGYALGARPSSVTKRLREIGARWQQDIRTAGDETKDLYLPLLRAASQEGVNVLSDLPYGPWPRQVLDIHQTAGANRAPVLVFVHGGAFVRGDKTINDQMYGNVLTWFAQRGCVGVNVEYRLAPEAPYPSGSLDLGLACAWLEQHIAQYGGDPRRICLLGHSAGGTHVASLLCDPRPELAVWSPDVACAVLVSARLRADVLPVNPNAQGVGAYYGDDVAAYEACSPVSHAARLRQPMFVANAQFENPLLDLYGLEFALALARVRGVAPLHVTLADHNHVSMMAHFNSGEQWLGEQILDFFESACR